VSLSLFIPGWNSTLFQSGISNLFDIQLSATLSGLSPANNCSIFSADVTTSGSPPDAASVAINSASCGPLSAGAVAGISVGATVALAALLFLFLNKVGCLHGAQKNKKTEMFLVSEVSTAIDSTKK
jgi:hypothetical protein